MIRSDVPTLTHKAGTLNHSVKAARVFFGQASALTLCSLKHVALTSHCTDAADVLSRFRHEIFMTFFQQQKTHFQSAVWQGSKLLTGSQESLWTKRISGMTTCDREAQRVG